MMVLWHHNPRFQSTTGCQHVTDERVEGLQMCVRRQRLTIDSCGLFMQEKTTCVALSAVSFFVISLAQYVASLLTTVFQGIVGSAFYYLGSLSSKVIFTKFLQKLIRSAVCFQAQKCKNTHDYSNINGMAATYTSSDHVSVLFWFKLSLIICTQELAMIIQLYFQINAIQFLYSATNKKQHISYQEMGP